MMPVALKTGVSILIFVAASVALLALWIPPKQQATMNEKSDSEKPASTQAMGNSAGGIQTGHGIMITGGNNQIGGSGNTQIVNADEGAFRPLSPGAKAKMVSLLRTVPTPPQAKPQVTFVPKMDNSVHIKIARELAAIVSEAGIQADVDENMLSYEPVDWGLVIHTHSETVSYLPAFAEALGVFFPDMKFQCNTNTAYPLGKIRINLLGNPAFTPEGTVRFH